MLSNKFMQSYVSLIAMIMTVAIVGPTYYFLTKYLALFIQEDYRQAVAVALGVLAVAVSHQMMAVIEIDKNQIINEIEISVQRIIRKN